MSSLSAEIDFSSIFIFEYLFSAAQVKPQTHHFLGGLLLLLLVLLRGRLVLLGLLGLLLLLLLFLLGRRGIGIRVRVGIVRRLLLLPLLALLLLLLVGLGLLLDGDVDLHRGGGRRLDRRGQGLTLGHVVVNVGVLPLAGRVVVGAAELVELAVLDQLLLQLSLLKKTMMVVRREEWKEQKRKETYPGSLAPPAGVGVPLEDHPLDLGDDAVVARGHVGGGHLRNAERDGLTLGGHHHDLLADLNALLIAEQTRDHELGTYKENIIDDDVSNPNKAIHSHRG